MRIMPLRTSLPLYSLYHSCNLWNLLSCLPTSAHAFLHWREPNTNQNKANLHTIPRCNGYQEKAIAVFGDMKSSAHNDGLRPYARLPSGLLIFGKLQFRFHCLQQLGSQGQGVVQNGGPFQQLLGIFRWLRCHRASDQAQGHAVGWMHGLDEGIKDWRLQSFHQASPQGC